MNKMIKMALVAMVAFVSTNVMAQTTETFAFGKVTTWTVGDNLDGQELVRKSAGLTMTFAKGDGETGPVVKNSSKPEATDVVVGLNQGNTITVTSTTNSITKVKFSFSLKSNAAINDNYEISEGTFESYTWEGKTSNFFIKNKSNDKGMEILRMEVTWVEGVTDGIEHVTTIDLQKDNKVYDLNGVCVGNDLQSVKKSGVYVVNGKKVVKK